MPSLVTRTFFWPVSDTRGKSSHGRDHLREMKRRCISTKARVRAYFSFSSTQQVTRTIRGGTSRRPRTREILRAPLREGRILIVARWISYFSFFFFFPSGFLQACILLSGDRVLKRKDVSARSLRRFKENNLSKISPSTVLFERSLTALRKNKCM